MAEVMLQRTRAPQADIVFRRFSKQYPTAVAFGRADPGELRELARPLGLQWRAERLVALAAAIRDRGGRLPRDVDALQTLPGVGPYAAAATLSFHGSHRAVIVDSNIVRVLCRLLGVAFNGETRRRVWLWNLANRLTPTDEFRAYNYALLDLAMRVCTPSRPHCVECPLSDLCVNATARPPLKEPRR